MNEFSEVASIEVTVVTPMHNAELFIRDTIKSVIAQSFKNWEMIVVDDCSIDSSREVVANFVRKDSRIRLITMDKNEGAAVARNIAISQARGRFIAFLDSDDEWTENKLQDQISFMKESRTVLSYSYYERMSEGGETLGDFVKPPSTLGYGDLLKSNQIGCLTAIYDTSVLGKVFMPQLRKRQDYGLWLKILRSGVRARCVPKVLARYRVRSKSISSNKLEMVRYNWELYRRVEGLPVYLASYYLVWNIVRKVLK